MWLRKPFCAKIWRAAVVHHGVARWLPATRSNSQACQGWQMAQTNEQYHSASYGMPSWDLKHVHVAQKAIFCAKIWCAAVVRHGVARWLPVDAFMSEACQSWQMAQTNEQYHSASSITFLCGPKDSVSTPKCSFVPKSGVRPWCVMV